MVDLDEVLHQVERNTPPDLWPVVLEHGARRSMPETARPRRWPTMLIAAAISLVALTFAWKAFAGVTGSAADGTKATPSPVASIPTAVETITFHDEGVEEFAPPPDGAAPGLSPEAAFDVFRDEHPGIALQSPDITPITLGSYSAHAADGSIRFADRLVFGFSFHACGDSLPASCEFWVFLDADTGHMLDTAWRD